MAAPLLETRDLSMHFGGVHAVRHVNFTLAEGELRCLIGPNGAGKSTFFKMLTGQFQPTHGHVLFRGQDISNAHAHEIARLGIGIKTQVPSVFDGLTVRENIWLAATRMHPGEQAKRRGRRDAAERIGLTGIGRAPGRPACPWPTAMGRARHGAVDRSRTRSCSTSRRPA